MKRLFIIAALAASLPTMAARSDRVVYEVSCFKAGKLVFRAYGHVTFPKTGGVKVKTSEGDEHKIVSADRCEVKNL